MAASKYNTGEVVGFADLVGREYDAIDYVKPGFPVGVVGGLVAPGASSKTYFAIQDGLTIASGRASRTMPRGGVLYLPAEDPINQVGRRVKAIAAAWGLSGEEAEAAAANWRAWPLMGEAPDLVERLENDERPLVDAICDVCAKQFTGDKVRLIIFDTLRRFTFNDENDGGAMSRFLGCMELLCKRLQCSCMYLHHSSKAAALQGQLSTQQAARGSSVLSDNIRYQEYLSPMTQEEAEKLGKMGPDGHAHVPVGGERGLYVRWGVSKQNYGHPVPEVWYKRGQEGVLDVAFLASVEKERSKRVGRGGGEL